MLLKLFERIFWISVICVKVESRCLLMLSTSTLIKGMMIRNTIGIIYFLPARDATISRGRK